MSFNPQAVKQFRFLSHSFEANSSLLRLRYGFDDTHEFEEVLEFKGGKQSLTENELQCLDTLGRLVHLVAGISYYKAACPQEISLSTAIPQSLASFLDTLYLQGLGEFAFKNNLSLSGKIRFPFNAEVKSEAFSTALSRKSAVLIGGGKDSLVSIELLKKANEPMVLLSVGNNPLISEVAEATSCEHIVIERTLSKNLFSLNSEGALNGHVPITAILSFVAAFAAILYDFDTIVLSNERSANSGNIEFDGMEVNHQFSKSLSCEKMIAECIQSHGVIDIKYFSLLRPLSELSIAKHFSSLTKYHQIFSSCNTNFKKIGPLPSDRWCKKCPKCEFVFLMLAPFMEPNDLAQIFGGNLLENLDSWQGYEELLGLSQHKPFECVGEKEEVIAAFALLAKADRWNGYSCVKEFVVREKKEDWDTENCISKTLAKSSEHLLTKKYETLVYEDC